MSFNNKERELKKINNIKKKRKMAAIFISIAILGVALVFGACFLIAELFWPIMAILVVFLLWKLVSQRKNEAAGGNEKPFDQEQEKD